MILTHANVSCGGGLGVYHCLSVCLSVFRTMSQKPMQLWLLAQKLNTKMFQCESWKPIYLGGQTIKGQGYDSFNLYSFNKHILDKTQDGYKKIKHTSHRNITRVRFCTPVGAGLFLVLLLILMSLCLENVFCCHSFSELTLVFSEVLLWYWHFKIGIRSFCQNL